MDFRFSPEEEHFRNAIRDWLHANLPAGWGTTFREPDDEAARFAFRLDWERKLHAAGWSGVAWPREYGGRGATLVEQAIFQEELARANAPESVNIIGRNLTAPTLMEHGTAAQKQRFLPKILSSEEIWCQGFSEPNSGSDLASARCRATVDGDDFLINGQKIWTSFAQYAQWCFVLARTNATAPKHQGLSFILVDMRSPGITIRPLVQITGDTEFSEVFFDDVRVPRDNLVGELDRGWRIAMTTLTYERGPEEALPRQVRFRRDLNAILERAAALRSDGSRVADDAAIRQKLAASYIDLELMRLGGLRSFSRVIKGETIGPEASLNKLYWSHMYQRMTEVAMDVEGSSGALLPGDADAPLDGALPYKFLQSRAMTIYSGSSEIQRNIIAERVLGLPR
jgi:alkylation response protein AidB-like acyl-CoA dehydrogenase